MSIQDTTTKPTTADAVFLNVLTKFENAAGNILAAFEGISAKRGGKFLFLETLEEEQPNILNYIAVFGVEAINSDADNTILRLAQEIQHRDTLTRYFKKPEQKQIIGSCFEITKAARKALTDYLSDGRSEEERPIARARYADRKSPVLVQGERKQTYIPSLIVTQPLEVFLRSEMFARLIELVNHPVRIAEAREAGVALFSLSVSDVFNAIPIHSIDPEKNNGNIYMFESYTTTQIHHKFASLEELVEGLIAHPFS